MTPETVVRTLALADMLWKGVSEVSTTERSGSGNYLLLCASTSDCAY